MRKRKWDNNTLTRSVMNSYDYTFLEWIENKETFKKMERAPHPLVIGLACLVMQGRGDLVYLGIIFNILKRYRNYNIRFLLEIDRQDGDLRKRTHEIKNILIEEKIIKNQKYSGDTAEKICKNIEVSNPNIQILVDDQKKILEQDVLFWIHVSAPLAKLLLGSKKPYIGVSEIACNTEDDPNDYCLGVPNLDEPSMQTCGFFLENKMYGVENLSKQSLALLKIRDPLFNSIVHGKGIKPSTEGCEKLINTTIFVHGYFSQGIEEYRHLLKAFCISNYVWQSQKNVFISMNSVIDKYLINFLNDYKFKVTLHVLDDQGQYQCKKNEVKGSTKKIDFLCKHFFSKEDLENLNDAAIFCFPTGDFTFQDSMSRGSLPLFGVPSHKMEFPFFFVKHIETTFPELTLFFDFFRILGLMAKLEDAKIKKPNLDELYHQNLVKGSEHYRDPMERLIVIIACLINKDLLDQWQVVCRYLINHHNAFYKVPDLINKMIEKHSRLPSLISSVGNRDCFFNN